MIRNQFKKGFIQIPIIIAIIAGVLAVGGGGYFGVNQYQKFQQEKVSARLKAQELSKIQHEKEVEAEEERKKQDSEIAKLKGEVVALKTRKPEIVKGTIAPHDYDNPSNTPSSGDTTSIIKQWRPRVAFIDCKIIFEGNNMGEQSGSGYLLGYDSQNGDIIILTNNHVMDVPIHNLYGEPLGITARPTSCDIKIPGENQFATVYKEDSPFGVSDKEDWALITVKDPTPFMTKTIKNTSGDNCKSKSELGEKVLILGYPGIGDQNDVTATDGIISGYDGNYYITSAKIEHGNSGGVAISLKNNCYLGIPTFVVTGSLESLARILNVNAVFPN